MSKIEDAIAKLNKKHGAGTVMRMGDEPDQTIESIPSGNVCLDEILGIGGFPVGRIIEFSGKEASGKTTLATQTIAEAQHLGKNCILVDAEHAFDASYAARLGVNVDDLFVSQPSYGEQALEVVVDLVESGEAGVIVVDSVAALTPRAEIEGDVGDAHVGLQARLMSQGMRKLAAITHDNNTLLIFINQLRENIGMMGFGPKTTTPGGRALKFYCSVRLELTPIGKIKYKEELIGDNVKVKTAKNRFAAPFQTVELELIYGKGFSNEGAIIDLCLDNGVFKQSGAWFSHKDGTKLGQGREAARTFLEENPDYAQACLDTVYNL
jgi:recombination protein RecA